MRWSNWGKGRLIFSRLVYTVRWWIGCTNPGSLTSDSRHRAIFSPTSRHSTPQSLSMPSSTGKSPFRYKLGRTGIYFHKAWSHLLMTVAVDFTLRTKFTTERVNFWCHPSGIWSEGAGCPLGGVPKLLTTLVRIWSVSHPTSSPMSLKLLYIVILTLHSVDNHGLKTTRN